MINGKQCAACGNKLEALELEEAERQKILAPSQAADPLCGACISLELDELCELAAEARRHPIEIESYNPAGFGGAAGEIPGSAIASTMAARELEERSGGRQIVGELLLIAATAAAVAVAIGADLWLALAF